VSRLLVIPAIIIDLIFVGMIMSIIEEFHNEMYPMSLSDKLIGSGLLLAAISIVIAASLFGIAILGGVK
jgi:hypothetical protein